MYLQNHTGLILTEASRVNLTGALEWLRAERGAVSCTLPVDGNLPTGGARQIMATLDVNGMVTA